MYHIPCINNCRELIICIEMYIIFFTSLERTHDVLCTAQYLETKHFSNFVNIIKTLVLLSVITWDGLKGETDFCAGYIHATMTYYYRINTRNYANIKLPYV